MSSLNQLFMKRLEFMWGVENELITAIPTLIAHATNEDLLKTLRDHLEETKGHRTRIEQIFSTLGHPMTSETAESFAMMMVDTEKTLAVLENENLKDVFIIAEASNVEHLEIANYTTLVTWAKHLTYDTAQDLLQKTLKEESGASENLNSIADGGLLRSGILDQIDETMPVSVM